MKSKGGKIEYLCSKCRSPEIDKVLIMRVQVSFLCVCGYFAPWRQRIKVSVKTLNKR